MSRGRELRRRARAELRSDPRPRGAPTGASRPAAVLAVSRALVAAALGPLPPFASLAERQARRSPTLAADAATRRRRSADRAPLAHGARATGRGGVAPERVDRPVGTSRAGDIPAVHRRRRRELVPRSPRWWHDGPRRLASAAARRLIARSTDRLPGGPAACGVASGPPSLPLRREPLGAPAAVVLQQEVLAVVQPVGRPCQSSTASGRRR